MTPKKLMNHTRGALKGAVMSTMVKGRLKMI